MFRLSLFWKSDWKDAMVRGPGFLFSFRSSASTYNLFLYIELVPIFTYHSFHRFEFLEDRVYIQICFNRWCLVHYENKY